MTSRSAQDSRTPFDEPPVLTEAGVAEILCALEQEDRLFEYQVRGVSVWQILRFAVGIDLQNLPLQRPSGKPIRSLLADTITGLKDLVVLLIRRAKVSFWVQTYASALRIRENGAYKDVYFDDLLAACPGGMKLQSSNVPGYEHQEERAMIKPHLNVWIVRAFGLIAGRLWPIRNDKGVFAGIASLIANRLGLSRYDEKFVRRKFSTFYWQSACYAMLLRRFRPHVVFVADTGEFPLLAACHREGIDFVEFQHGIFTTNHPDALPATALEFGSSILLPTRLAVYGEHWSEKLRQTALGVSGRIVAVGSPMIDSYRAFRRNRPVSAGGPLIVTLTTQGLDTEKLIKFLTRFLNASGSLFEFNIKLHPAYDNLGGAYAEAFGADPRVKIISGRVDPNTYELIARSDLHLSIASACHYDALGLGVPTIVLGLSGHELMKDLIDAGSARITMTGEDLARIVDNRAWTVVATDSQEYYFKSGFVKNVSEIADIA